MDESRLISAVLRQKRNVTEDAIDWMEVAKEVDYIYATVECKERWSDIQKYEGGGKSNPWSFNEDSALQSILKRLKGQYINRDKIDWICVAKMLNTDRSAKQCLARWSMLLQMENKWNDIQDALLITAVHKQEYGDLNNVNWMVVSKFLRNYYTPKQCRERWEVIHRTTRNEEGRLCTSQLLVLMPQRTAVGTKSVY